MSHRTLIAYASRAGSTAEVAETIGNILRETGMDVDVRSVKDVRSLMGYDALVLGSAIWAGKPLPEMQRFVADQHETLAQLPVAYFILCDALREYTPANRQIAFGYLAPLRAAKQPLSVGLFAGCRDFSKVHPVLRWFLMHVVRLAEGDWRDWEQIRAWAAELGPQLANARPELAATG